ncbi:MAG TPA: protein phosphatase 2C domain-containing protein [Gemmataceae bacterium]|nr:protein phosphatase 2C domain-containing protein [Gemmataceae bacterium]
MPAPVAALCYRALRVPRRGHTAEECQDAVAGAPDRSRFAVADGASESADAGLWARLLVEDFVASPARHLAWSSWLPPLQARWAAEADALLPGGALPWYLEERAREGAFATFLGVAVEDSAWHALAVGDSCLFQLRGGALLRSFPLQRADEFGSTPWLIGSRPPGAEVAYEHGQRAEGDWQAGDRLWLMTDALAQWFLRQAEEGGRPWETLGQVLAEAAPDEAFAAWVGVARALGQLRNDDVTLAAVNL